MLVSTYDVSRVHMMCLATVCRQVAAVATSLGCAPECAASAIVDEMRSRHAKLPQALEGALAHCRATCKARIEASLDRNIDSLRRLNPEAIRAASELRTELKRCTR